MILKTFNLRSVADRMQKSGTDPGATTTCPRSVVGRMQKSGTDPGTATTCPTRSVAGRDQLIMHTYAQHRRVRDYMHTQRTTHTHTRPRTRAARLQDATPLGVAFIARPHTCVYARI